MEGRQGEKKAEIWLRGDLVGREVKWADKVGNTTDGVRWEEGCGAKVDGSKVQELRGKGNR